MSGASSSSPFSARVVAILIAVAAISFGAVLVMAGWALSRAHTLGDAPARAVAVGALFFLASDATLAINRFVTPLPHAAVWVLGSYYAAQCFLVMGWLRGQAPALPRHALAQGT